jgi:hypothetical protein
MAAIMEDCVPRQKPENIRWSLDIKKIPLDPSDPDTHTLNRMKAIDVNIVILQKEDKSGDSTE